MEQGRLAMCHAFNLTYKNKLASILPYGLYTIPEIGMAGLTEDEARELGINYEVGRAFFSENARGQIIGDMGGGKNYPHYTATAQHTRLNNS